MKKNILRKNGMKNIFYRKIPGFHAHKPAQGSLIQIFWPIEAQQPYSITDKVNLM